MKTKNIFVILMFLIVLFSVSSVSAEEILETNDISALSADDAVEVMSVSESSLTWDDLKADVENENVSEIMYSGADVVPTSQITFNHDLTIIGASGSSIGNANSYNITSYSFTPFISNSNVNINIVNMTFRNMNNEILFQLGGNGNYVFENCVFENVNATGAKKSVIWFELGTGLVDNCIFSNCTTQYGTISNFHEGDVNAVQLTVKDSTFSDNYAGTSCGAINNCGQMTVVNSTFNHNRAGWWAGAVHTHIGANTTIRKSRFVDNVAGWNGGALYTYSTLTLIDSDFIGNNCTTNTGGGAIGSLAYWGQTSPTMTVINCNFTNNVNNNGAGNGGAIAFSGGTLDVYGTYFEGNDAVRGTAIYASGLFGSNIVNNTFIANTGVKNGSDTLVLSGNYNLENNSYSEDTPMTIDVVLKSEFTFGNSVDCNIRTTSIYSDYIKTAAYEVFVDGESYLNTTGNEFSVAVNDNNEHVVYVVLKGRDEVSNNVTVPLDAIYVSTTGSASGNGSASNPFNNINDAINAVNNDVYTIIVEEGTYYLSSSSSVSKSFNIEGQGNVIFDGSLLSGSNLFSLRTFDYSFKNITFSNFNKPIISYATRPSNFYPNVAILNCTFKDNSISNYMISAYSIFVENSKFINNTINNGIFYLNKADSRLEITDSIFNNNIASGNGAVFNGNSFTSANFNGCLFVDNSANNGAVIYIVPSSVNVNVNDCVFLNNVASGDGNIITSNSPVAANNNWWGNTEYDYTIAPNVSSSVIVNNWLFLDETHNAISQDMEHINLKLSYYSNISNIIYSYDSSNLPSIPINIDVDNYAITDSSIVLSNGQTSFNVYNLTTNNYTVDVNYYSNLYSFIFSFDNSKLSSYLYVRVKDMAIGGNATLVINIPQYATGNIIVNVNGVNRTLEIINGELRTSTLDLLSNLENIKYDISVTYYGDNNYFGAYNSTFFMLCDDNSPWAMIGHDNKNSGKTSIYATGDTEVGWSTLIGENSTNMVIDADNNIYIANNNVIYAFRNDGTLLWNYSVIGYSRFTGLAIDRDVIVATREGYGIYFINRFTGKDYSNVNIWQGSSLYEPVFDDAGTIYISGEYQVDTGHYILTVIPYSTFMFGDDIIVLTLPVEPLSAPVVISDGLICFNTAEGIVFTNVYGWSEVLPIYGDSASRPVVDSNLKAYYLLDGYLNKIDLNNSALDNVMCSGSSLTLDESNNILFVVDGQIINVYDMDLNYRGNITSDDCNFTNVIIDDGGFIYAVTDSNYISKYSFDISSMTDMHLCDFELNNTVRGSLAIDNDGSIYVCDVDGILYCFGYVPDYSYLNSYSFSYNEPLLGLSCLDSLNDGFTDEILLGLETSNQMLAEEELDEFTWEYLSDWMYSHSDWMYYYSHTLDMDSYYEFQENSDFTPPFTEGCDLVQTITIPKGYYYSEGNSYLPLPSGAIAHWNYIEDDELYYWGIIDIDDGILVNINWDGNNSIIDGKGTDGFFKLDNYYPANDIYNADGSPNDNVGPAYFDSAYVPKNYVNTTLSNFTFVNSHRFFSITDLHKNSPNVVNLTIFNCTFINCTSYYFIGYNNVAFINCTFINCSAVRPILQGIIPGAINKNSFIKCLDNNQIINCTFKNLNADSRFYNESLVFCPLVAMNSENVVIKNNYFELIEAHAIVTHLSYCSFANESIYDNYIITNIEKVSHSYTIRDEGKVYDIYSYEDEIFYGNDGIYVDDAYNIINYDEFGNPYIWKISLRNYNNYPFKTNIIPSLEGSDLVFTLNTSDNGNLTLGDGTIVKITEGKGSTPITATPGDTIQGTITGYLGDKYYALSSDYSLTVPKLSPNLNITEDDLEFEYGQPVEIVIELESETNEANVSIYDKNGKLVDSKLTKDTVTFNNIAAGEYTINVIYDEDDTFTNDSATATLTITKATPELTLDVVNTTSTLEISISTDIDDDIIVNVNGDEYKLNKDNTTFTLSNQGEGKYYVTATYGGNENYTSVSRNKTVTLFKVDSNLEVNAEVANNIVTITSTLTPTTGTITYIVNNKQYTKAVGESLIIDDLNHGEYTVFASYAGDSMYNAANANDTFTISEKTKLDPELKLDIKDTLITVSINKDATGDVIVTVGDISFIQDAGDLSPVDVSKYLGNGTYDVKVTYSGDDNFTEANESGSVTVPEEVEPVVVLKDPNLKLDIKDTVITVSINKDATGDVIVNVGDISFVRDASELAPIDVGEYLSNGTYPVSVKYVGDDVFAEGLLIGGSVTVPDEPVVEPKDPNLKATATNTTVSVSVDKDATGNVLVDVEGNGYYAPIKDGKAVIEVIGLDAGTYTATVSYVGDDNFKASNATVKITVPEEPVVEPKDPNLKLDIKDTTITVSINKDATGDVIVSVGDISFVRDAGELAPIDVSEYLSNGTYPVSVKYVGDDVFAEELLIGGSVTVPDEPVVEPKDPNLKLDIKDTTITVSINKDATGDVIVTVGDISFVQDAGELAPIDVSKYLTNGTYPVTVKYVGDGIFAEKLLIGGSVTVPDEPVVEPKDPSLKATASNTTVTVSVDKDATGNVLVDVEGNGYYAPINDGRAVIEVIGLDAGTYTASVSYLGDDNFKAANATVKVTVPEEPVVEPKDPNLKATASNTTINISVDKDATGNVLVDVGGNGYYAPIKDGQASVNVIGLDEGKYQANVNYVGDDNFKASSATVTVTVPSSGKNDTPVNPKADIKISEDSVSVELPGDATGYVLVDVDGKGYYAPVKDGKASIDLPELEAGNHTVTVTYTGDNKYQSANATKTISIEDEIETIIAEDLTKVEKAPDRFEATFNDASGKALANTDVTFTLNGVTYTRTTDANGKASIGINLDAGNYTIIVSNPVTKDSKELKINVLSRFAVHNDLTKYFRNATQYVVKILDDEGNPAKAGEVVTFNINGVFYNRTSDANGNVKLNINLNPGDYIITAEYKGCRVSNNIKVLPILTGKDLTKKFGQPGQFEATLVDGQGKAYANQEVVFNINGVFYTRTTDANGVAKLNINLQAGKYIITSYYKEAVTSNTVTVTA